MTGDTARHAPDRPRRVGGRTRSREAQDDVLRAAVEILEESGYAAVTMDGVAARSGAAKSTIYRWWSSKADLVMEAYGSYLAERMPQPDTGAVRADLITFVTELYRITEHPVRVTALRGLMAEAQLDPAFGAAFRTWIRGRRDAMATILNRGVDNGEISADVDLAHAIDLIFGPFWYRLLVGHEALDPQQSADHVDRLLGGLAGRPTGEQRAPRTGPGRPEPAGRPTARNAGSTTSGTAASS